MRGLCGLIIIGMIASVCFFGCRTGERRRVAPVSSEELVKKLGLEGGSDRIEGRRIRAKPFAREPGIYKPKGIAVKDLEGRPVSLASYEGSWLLLAFFTTYSNPSQFQMEDLNLLYKEYGKSGLEVAAVSLDLNGGHEMVAAYIEALQVEFDVYMAVGETKTGKTPYGYIKEIPLTLLIDPDGRQVIGYLGPVKRSRIEDDIKSHIDIR